MSIFEDMVLDKKDRHEDAKAIMYEIEQLPTDTLQECFGTESAEELFSLGKFALVEKIYSTFKTRKDGQNDGLKFGDVVELINVLTTTVTGIVLDYDSEIKEYGIMIKSPEENRPEWGPLVIVYVPREHIVKSEEYFTSVTKSIIDWLKGMKK